MRGVAIENLVGIVGSVPTGSDAAEFEPVVSAIAVAVHSTVNDDRRFSFLVGFEDALDPRRILNVSKALVVDHDIIRIRPIWVLIQRYLGKSPVAALLYNGDLKISPGFESMLDEIFLSRVVVTASASDHQDLDRLGFSVYEARSIVAAKMKRRVHDDVRRDLGFSD
jgi:hypothetical protein